MTETQGSSDGCREKLMNLTYIFKVLTESTGRLDELQGGLKMIYKFWTPTMETVVLISGTLAD